MDKFNGIEDVIGKWIVVYFLQWPQELESPVTGLKNVTGEWRQYKLQGVDSLGIWLENPYFDVSVFDDEKVSKLPNDQIEALKGKALVLVRWEYIGTIIYLEEGKNDKIRMGFQPDQ